MTEPNGITRLALKRSRKIRAQRVAHARATCCWIIVVSDIAVVHVVCHQSISEPHLSSEKADDHDIGPYEISTAGASYEVYG